MRYMPVLSNESDRLAAVAEYELVPDDQALELDAILQLAAALFSVPTALVSIVERDRQLFTARRGLDVCETGRDIAFCAHALGLDDVMVVLDAKLDPRFVANPLVVGKPFIRFYAGMPLRAPSGHVLGTLCIIDQRPRNAFSLQDREHLKALATLVMDKLEARRLSIAYRAGQSRFEQIAATSPVGIVCADHQGRITFWNAACEQLFGYNTKEALGTNIELIVPSHMRGGHGAGLRRAAAGEAPRPQHAGARAAR